MFSIRPAQRADLDAIFAIYDPHVLRGTCTFETQPKSPPERDRWFDHHSPDRHPLLVAVDDASRETVGWAGLSPWSPREAYARTAESSVYVRETHQGRGVARSLMRSLLSSAAIHTPVRLVVARIVLPNPASIRLHESLGFGSIGTMRRCGEKFGRLLDVLLMDLHFDEHSFTRYA